MFSKSDWWASPGKPGPFFLSLLIVACSGQGWAQAQEMSLSLAEAERLAVAKEPGVTARLERAQAFREQAVADRQLPNPALVVGAFNVPADDFSIDTEPMAQLRLGVRQLFPRGHSRRSSTWRSRSAGAK